MKENTYKDKSRHDLRLSDIHKSDKGSYLAVLNNALEKEVQYKIEYRLMSRTGQYVWISEEGIPIFFRGNPICQGFICGCVDIDVLKKSQINLEMSEERYRRLFETARDGILILNSRSGEITDVNPFLMELLGYSKAEFLGLCLWEVGAFKNIKANKEAFKKLQEEGYIRYDDLPLEAKDGRLISVGFVSNAYMTGDERVIQCNIRDLSEQKKLEAAEKSLTLLKQEKVKSAFIADVTHELRTPLAIIKGSVELALRAKENTKMNKETYEAINVEVDHLAEILSDLAILTDENQIFSHTMEKAKASVDISKVISQVVGRLKRVGLKKNLTIEMKTIPSAILHSNKDYLEKLFSNIISNAIFYSNEGGLVSVSALVKSKYIEVCVQDNGIGISKDELPSIFERFYRTAKAREVNHEGTGLGLAISKYIVEANGGTISITSKESVGTTVSIVLPLA